MEKLNKVAKITLLFWILKILATTLGETLGDLLSMTLNIGYLISLGITLLFFIVTLFIQLKLSKFNTAIYWLVIVGTTTVGTEISDFMDRSLGFGYALGSLILFSGLMKEVHTLISSYTLMMIWIHWISNWTGSMTMSLCLSKWLLMQRLSRLGLMVFK